jgi:hypothetical protein
MRQTTHLCRISALTLYRQSLQVAVSPCWQMALPDIISANLSPDAWPPTPAVPRSAHACFFLLVIGLPQIGNGSAFRYFPRTRLSADTISKLQAFLYVQASGFAHLPGRSYRSGFPLGSRGLYVRAYRALLPPHASDMLTARKQAIGGVRTFT